MTPYQKTNQRAIGAFGGAAFTLLFQSALIIKHAPVGGLICLVLGAVMFLAYFLYRKH